MLRAARYIDFGMTDEPGKRAADEGAGVTRGGNVGIAQHGVTETAQTAVVAGLCLGENRHELDRRTELAGGSKTCRRINK